MGKKKETRGVTEASCFSDMKRILFRPGVFDGDTSDCVVSHIFTENALSHFACGVDKEDLRRIFDVIRTCVPNPNPSEFPDFVSPLGFIEHFQITATHVTSKGSPFSKQTSDINKEFDAFHERVVEQGELGKLYQKTAFIPAPKADYEYLQKSFKDRWTHHVDSFSKYSGSKDVSVFMVDMRDEGSLSMCEKCPIDTSKPGRYYGDVWRELYKFHGYRLSFDKNLLSWIYERHDGIKYILFLGPFYEDVEAERDSFGAVYGLGCDIIAVENIPSLLTLNPFGCNIHCVMLFRTPYAAAIKLPN